MDSKIAFVTIVDCAQETVYELGQILNPIGKQHGINFIISNKSIETMTKQDLMDIVGKLD